MVLTLRAHFQLVNDSIRIKCTTVSIDPAGEKSEYDQIFFTVDIDYTSGGADDWRQSQGVNTEMKLSSESARIPFFTPGGDTFRLINHRHYRPPIEAFSCTTAVPFHLAHFFIFHFVFIYYFLCVFIFYVCVISFRASVSTPLRCAVHSL